MRGDESFSHAAIIDLTDDASRAGVTAGDGAHKLQRTSGAPSAGYADARRTRNSGGSNRALERHERRHDRRRHDHHGPLRQQSPMQVR